MDQTTFERLKTTLEAERDRLAAEVAEFDREEREMLSEASGENNYRDHMADQGSATFERELDMTLEENARVALEEVQAALTRMGDETYGVCARCGAVIPVERLEAVPTASLCIACKADDECR
jgi:RNA polymerase-binding protein DksA